MTNTVWLGIVVITGILFVVSTIVFLHNSYKHLRYVHDDVSEEDEDWQDTK